MSTSAILQSAQIAAPFVLIKPKRGIYNPTIVRNKKEIVLPDIIAQATIEEKHFDRLEITNHPIEQGAAITDHAFANPPEVMIRLGWSNSSSPNSIMAAAEVAAAWAATLGGSVGSTIAGIGGAASAINNLLSVTGESKIIEAYNILLQMYYSRAVFNLYTGKRIYSNMICKMICTETDYMFENSMVIVLECQELIMVSTKTVSLPASNQANPKSTASPVNSGTQQMISK